MTAQAATAAAQPGAAKSPTAMARPRGSTGAAGPAAAVPGAYTRKVAHPMRDQPSVTDLVTSARNGGKQAWDAPVERYAWPTCRQHGLGGIHVPQRPDEPRPRLYQVRHIRPDRGISQPCRCPGAGLVRRPGSTGSPRPSLIRPADRAAAMKWNRHPGRQHRADPPPLPGHAALLPGYRSADQRRRRDRGVRCAAMQVR
jgi:hypothetical protein